MLKHAASMTVTLFALWLLLSGHYDPMLLGLGFASTAFAVFLALRMEVIDHESYPFHLTGRLIRFWLFLSKEIVFANVDVVKRILGPKRNIKPQLVRIRPPQRTELGLVIYANSITLTPGTVSMEVTPESITVHALSPDAAADLEAGRMARRVPESGFRTEQEKERQQ